MNDFEIMVKKYLLRVFMHIFKYDSWHCFPVEIRPYAKYIIRTVNYMIERNEINGPIVDIGCGLGGIIGNIRSMDKKYGYDISGECIRFAKIIHPFTAFKVGSFKDVDVGDAGCVILVGFVHLIDYANMKKSIEDLLKKNKVDMFVIDTFTHNESTCYQYSHDGKRLFGNQYVLVRKRGFKAAEGARRYIEFWQKVC